MRYYVTYTTRVHESEREIIADSPAWFRMTLDEYTKRESYSTLPDYHIVQDGIIFFSTTEVFNGLMFRITYAPEFHDPEEVYRFNYVVEITTDDGTPVPMDELERLLNNKGDN